jgi:hypothetical protein
MGQWGSGLFSAPWKIDLTPFQTVSALGLLFGLAGLGVLIGPDIVLVRAAPLGASLMPYIPHIAMTI